MSRNTLNNSLLFYFINCYFIALFFSFQCCKKRCIYIYVYSNLSMLKRVIYRSFPQQPCYLVISGMAVIPTSSVLDNVNLVLNTRYQTVSLIGFRIFDIHLSEVALYQEYLQQEDQPGHHIRWLSPQS